jgi:hypothetical protein
VTFGPAASGHWALGMLTLSRPHRLRSRDPEERGIAALLSPYQTDPGDVAPNSPLPYPIPSKVRSMPGRQANVCALNLDAIPETRVWFMRHYCFMQMGSLQFAEAACSVQEQE